MPTTLNILTQTAFHVLSKWNMFHCQQLAMQVEYSIITHAKITEWNCLHSTKIKRGSAYRCECKQEQTTVLQLEIPQTLSKRPTQHQVCEG